MKNYLIFILISVFVIILGTSCKKDKTTAVDTGFVKKIITDDSVKLYSYYFPIESVVVGYKFYVKKPVTITKLGCYLGSAGKHQLTLYHGTLLPSISLFINPIAQVSIDVTSQKTWFYEDIAPLKLAIDSFFLVIDMPAHSFYYETVDINPLPANDYIQMGCPITGIMSSNIWAEYPDNKIWGLVDFIYK